MKIFKHLIAVAIAVAALTLNSNASLIDLGIRSLDAAIGNPTNEAAYIEADQSLAAGSLTYLNKFETDSNGFEDGGAVGSSHFDVTLAPGGANALVSWDLAGTGYQLNYVFVKDGRDPSTRKFLYHLYGVTADQAFNSVTDQLVTINGQKGISHISFFGTPGNNVPDGGTTLMLLGAGLGAVGLARRRFGV